VEEVDRRGARARPAPVVARGGADVGVARQLLDRGKVGTRVEEVAHPRPPEIVRGEVVDARLGRATRRDPQRTPLARSAAWTRGVP